MVPGWWSCCPCEVDTPRMQDSSFVLSQGGCAIIDYGSIIHPILTETRSLQKAALFTTVWVLCKGESAGQVFVNSASQNVGFRKTLWAGDTEAFKIIWKWKWKDGSLDWPHATAMKNQEQLPSNCRWTEVGVMWGQNLAQARSSLSSVWLFLSPCLSFSPYQREVVEW